MVDALSRPEAAALLRRLLAEEVDPCLAEEGFRRRLSSVVYSRSIADGGRQRLEMRFGLRPPFAPHDIHLDPIAEVAFPRLDTVVDQMLGGVGHPVAIRTPLQLLAPPGSNVWLGRDELTLRHACRGALAHGIAPALEGLNLASSHAGLIELEQRRNPNLFVTWPAWAHVAASYVLEGDPSGGRKMLERHLAGKPSDRASLRAALTSIERPNI